MVDAAVTDPDILSAARRALERDGWSQTTLERVAQEAGLSRMTLHRRGVTREAILAGLAATLEAEHRVAMWPVLTADGSARERLERALGAICENTERNLELLLALGDRSRAAIYHDGGPAGSYPGEDAAPDAAVLTRDVFTEPIARLLRDGAADGTLRAVADPTETATVIFNLVGWTYRHLRRGHGWAPARARAGVLAIALDGVAARDPRDAGPPAPAPAPTAGPPAPGAGAA